MSSDLIEPVEHPAPHDLTEEEFAELESCETEAAWFDICQRVKAARGGQYPNDWFPRVVCSGLARERIARWSTREQT
jgi:hypothetical protein